MNPTCPRQLIEYPSQSLLAHRESSHDLRVELPAGHGEDLVGRVLPGQGPSVRPVARHRIECVRDREDSRTDRNLLVDQSVRISTTVPALVVVLDDLDPVALEQRDLGENRGADRRMSLDLLP